MRLPTDVYLAGVAETDELDGAAPFETSEAAAAPSPAEAAIAPYRMARAEALAAFERSYLRRLIEATGGNASAAARAANMDRPYLLSLLKRHGLR